MALIVYSRHWVVDNRGKQYNACDDDDRLYHIIRRFSCHSSAVATHKCSACITAIVISPDQLPSATLVKTPEQSCGHLTWHGW
jgi:hypothetical protein